MAVGGMDAGQRSERGPRESNQDAVFCTPLPDGAWVAAVADGMGGLESGEVASRLAIRALESGLRGGQDLTEAVHAANAVVFDRTRAEPMGTTLVVALVREDSVYFANVGDSRGYHFGPLGIQQITRDHTLRAEAARSGHRVAREAEASRWSDSLTRSIGGADSVVVDEFGPYPFHEGDRLLLCSDGVYRALAPEVIEECVMRSRDAQEGVDRLIEAALEAGADDNLSAVILRPVGDDMPLFEARSSGGGSEADWDPIRMMQLSGRSLPRKSGVPRGAYVVMALVLGVLALAYFLA